MDTVASGCIYMCVFMQPDADAHDGVDPVPSIQTAPFPNPWNPWCALAEKEVAVMDVTVRVPDILLERKNGTTVLLTGIDSGY